MIDYDLFKKILTNDDCGYIENYDFISNELLTLFASSKVERVKSLFKKGDESVYDVELKCERCGKIFIIRASKSKIYTILQHLRGNSKRDYVHLFCPDCECIHKEEEKQKMSQLKEKLHREELEKTKIYIDSYLDPNKSWKKGVKTWVKIDELKRAMGNPLDIANFIKNMSYADFLKTPYWNAIAENVKKKANYRCQMCNSTENLNVHHRSYQNHGNELHHMEDLICLCKECHTKYHFD